MNHCLLEVKVKQPPTIRYTQDNKTPLAEMEVLFEGLRDDDPPRVLKVVGWGNMAQELQSRVQVNATLVVEGRLRMNTVPRKDGTKEKKAELTLSRLHFPNQNKEFIDSKNNSHEGNQSEKLQSPKETNSINNAQQNPISWDSSPLVPDTDEIPF